MVIKTRTIEQRIPFEKFLSALIRIYDTMGFESIFIYQRGLSDVYPTDPGDTTLLFIDFSYHFRT